MTDDEALTLSVGDRVEVLYGLRHKGPRVWLAATVVDKPVAWPNDSTRVGVRLLTPQRPGQRGYKLRPAQGLRRPLVLDPVTSNVFADFLDERGEHKAAAMLREAFPLVRADGTAGQPAQSGTP